MKIISLVVAWQIGSPPVVDTPFAPATGGCRCGSGIDRMAETFAALPLWAQLAIGIPLLATLVWPLIKSEKEYRRWRKFQRERGVDV